MAAHIFFACWLNYKQEIIGETVCCVRLSGKILGRFFSFIVFCIFAL